MTRYAALGRDAAGLDAAVGILDAAPRRPGAPATTRGGRGRGSDSGARAVVAPRRPRDPGIARAARLSGHLIRRGLARIRAGWG